MAMCTRSPIKPGPPQRLQEDAGHRSELERDNDDARKHIGTEQGQAALLQSLHQGLDPTQRKPPEATNDRQHPKLAR
jgi:hypothetical protein